MGHWSLTLTLPCYASLHCEIVFKNCLSCQKNVCLCPKQFYSSSAWNSLNCKNTQDFIPESFYHYKFFSKLVAVIVRSLDLLCFNSLCGTPLTRCTCNSPQGIRHVDHFGFICRESSESGTCQFVCYVFQCTDGSLVRQRLACLVGWGLHGWMVSWMRGWESFGRPSNLSCSCCCCWCCWWCRPQVDEIMLTLKQAFSVAAQQQVSQAHGQQCEHCPMLTLHRVCERIEGELCIHSHCALGRIFITTGTHGSQGSQIQHHWEQRLYQPTYSN